MMSQDLLTLLLLTFTLGAYVGQRFGFQNARRRYERYIWRLQDQLDGRQDNF